MNALRANDMGSERSALRLMAAFALSALIISGIGLYGLISFSVAQRTQEFGVRLALGADARQMRRLVLTQGIRPAIIGSAISIAGSLAVLRVMQSMLFRVSPGDPLTLGAVVLVVCAVALAASYVPARRAMRVDPMKSLREE